jgi:transposase-like protein
MLFFMDQPLSTPRRDLPKTWPDRFSVVEDYLSSGLTMKVFSKAHGLGQSTLTKWVSEYKKRKTPAPAVSPAPHFIEVSQHTAQVTPSATSPKPAFEFSLELKNGIRLHFCFDNKLSRLPELLRRLESL